jgi:protein SCO1/2
MKTIEAEILLVICLLMFASDAFAQSLSKPTLLNLRFDQKLNAQLPLDVSFTDDAGHGVQLRDYFGTRPGILVLGYYECPMLCGLVLNGIVETLQEIRATPGKDFVVIFVSIDPRETSALAAAKKRTYLKRYGRPGTDDGWHFLTGRESEIKAISESVGFQFAFDRRLNQYAHPSGIVVLTPEGRVAKYFFGVNYPAKELSAALKESSAHRVGSPVRQLLILCFQHMPLAGRNSAAMMGVVRALAAATLVALVAYVAIALRREKVARLSRLPSSAVGQRLRSARLNPGATSETNVFCATPNTTRETRVLPESAP